MKESRLRALSSWWRRFAAREPEIPSQALRADAARAACIALAALAAACTRVETRTWPDGAARSCGAVSLLTGREQGEWTWWYPSGERRESGRFEDGVRVGLWRQWWSNGEPRSMGQREPLAAAPARDRSSPRAGEWTFWHPSGAIAARGVYRAGLREGHWECSLDDGSLDGDASGEHHLGERLGDG